MRVDLGFPDTPKASDGAKDFVQRVRGEGGWGACREGWGARARGGERGGGERTRRGRVPSETSAAPPHPHSSAFALTPASLPPTPLLRPPSPPLHLLPPLFSALPHPHPQLLVKDVTQRMRLEDVPEHPWIRANADPAVLTAAL